MTCEPTLLQCRAKSLSPVTLAQVLLTAVVIRRISRRPDQPAATLSVRAREKHRGFSWFSQFQEGSLKQPYNINSSTTSSFTASAIHSLHLFAIDTCYCLCLQLLVWLVVAGIEGFKFSLNFDLLILVAELLGRDPGVPFLCAHCVAIHC